MMLFYLIQEEVLKIILLDHVFFEFGYDKEALRAAIIKWNVDEDDDFEPYLSGLDIIRDTTFINN